jgi:hypothetical protein
MQYIGALDQIQYTHFARISTSASISLFCSLLLSSLDLFSPSHLIIYLFSSPLLFSSLLSSELCSSSPLQSSLLLLPHSTSFQCTIPFLPFLHPLLASLPDPSTSTSMSHPPISIIGLFIALERASGESCPPRDFFFNFTTPLMSCTTSSSSNPSRGSGDGK